MSRGDVSDTEDSPALAPTPDRERRSPGESDRLSAIHAWQDRVRAQSLTILLVLEFITIFVALPLAAKGLPIAPVITDTLAFCALATVVALSHRWGAIAAIVVGMMAVIASYLMRGAFSPVTTTALRHCGNILAFCALARVAADIVYAPGRVTSHRLQAAVVFYLAIATTFGMIYGLIWVLNPDAFVNVTVPEGGLQEVGTMLYFSLSTLTTTGYGDIVAVDPLARSLSNLEAMLGQFYLAITVTRLVTLELNDRGR
jgi:Ion channel